jgi:hypothetical protein
MKKKYLGVLELEILLKLVTDELDGLAGLTKVLMNTATATALFTVAFLLAIVLLLHVVFISLLV